VCAWNPGNACLTTDSAVSRRGLLYAADIPAVRPRIWMGDQSTIPLGAGRNLYLTLPRGWHEKLHARVTVRESLNAPVQLGQAVGTIALDLASAAAREYPLVALKQVGEGNLLQRTIDKIQLGYSNGLNTTRDSRGDSGRFSTAYFL